MTDRVATYELGFAPNDDGTVRSFLAGIKGQFSSAAADIERSTSKIKLFGDTEAKIQATAAALQRAKQDVTTFTAALAAAQGQGKGVTTELEAGLKKAQAQVVATTREFDKQASTLSRLQGQLTRVGVDTKNLANEEARLAAELAKVTAAQTQQQANQVLGIKTQQQARAEIAQLNAAFNTLRASGTLSYREIAVAQSQLAIKSKEIQASVTGVAAAAKVAGAGLADVFVRPLVSALGFTAGIATVVAGFRDVIAVTKEYKQTLAEIGAGTNLTREQVDALGKGVRQLSVDLGVDVQEALRGTFELIRSGVPAENALSVLAVSVKAAKAASTDLGTSIKVTNLLLDAFGAEISDLPLLFDKIAVGGKRGGVSLKEFAENAGPLLNVARAAGISFDDLLATLTVFANKSGDAGTAISSLTKIIAKLDTSETRANLRELGITATDLVGIFRQVGERGLRLEQVLGLDLSSGGARAAAALATLTNNSALLPESLEKIANAAGTTERALNSLYDSPAARSARFNAQLRQAELNIGRVVGSGSILGVVATQLFESFNLAVQGADQFSEALGDSNKSLLDAIKANFDVGPAAEEARRGFDQVSRAADNAAAATARNEVATARNEAQIKKSQAALSDFGTTLLAQVQAIQAATTRDLGDIAARADAQIAALDRSVKATADTAAKTLAIQTQANAARLSALTNSEAAISKVLVDAIAARTAAAGKGEVEQRKLAQDTANARLAALVPVLAQYQAFYNDLVRQSQESAAKIQSIEQTRIEFNRGIEKTLFDIRLQGLSVFDQYVAKAQEADRLISEARKAGVLGDIANAKKFTDEAIALAGTLGKVTTENGLVIVTQTQAQQQALGIVKKAQDGLNTSLDEQSAAAQKGADATKQSIDQVLPKLEELQGKYDALKRTVAEGLDLQIKLDQISVTAAFQKLNELTQPRTVTVTVKTVTASGAPAGDQYVPPSVPGLARGGHVDRAASGLIGFATGFATGGPVFRRPGYAKVPGSGSGDIVPAALESGSFVVRKSAARAYGDAVMGRIVRGYAAGGPITVGGGGLTVPLGVPTRFTNTFDQLKRLATLAGGLPKGGGANIAEWAQTLADSFPTLPDSSRAVINVALGRALGNLQNAILRGLQEQSPVFVDPTLAALADASPAASARSTPSDAKTAGNVVGYARAALELYRSLPGGQLTKFAGPELLGRIAYVEAHPTDTEAIDQLLKAAIFLGQNSNLQAFVGKTSQGTPGTSNFRPPLTFEDWLRERHIAFAGGGDVGPRDTVRAMLEPGEFVVSRNAVDSISRLFGGGFLPALNAQRIAPGALAGMLDIAPPPRPRGYADGGPVEYTPSHSLGPRPSSVSGIRDININANAGDLLSPNNVRRFIVPVLRDIERKR